MKLKYSVGIATKMIFIVTVLIISAIGVVVYIASDLFHEDSVTKVQETNKDSAAQLAERVYSIFQDTTEKMTLMAQFATHSENADEAKRAIDNTLRGSDDLISFSAQKFNDQGEPEPQFFSANESALAEFNLDQKKLEAALSAMLLSRHKSKPNELVLINSSPQFGVPLFTMSFLSQSQKTSVAKSTEVKSELAGRWWFRAEIRHDRILKLFTSKKFITSYLVDSDGKLMAHSDPEKSASVIKGESVAMSPMVAKMMNDTADNHQMSYINDNEENYLGAYKKVGVAGIGVVAEVSEAKALATIKRVQYRSFLVMIVVVCVAFFLNFGFSKSLTSNLKKLFAATEQIVTGKFDVDLQVKSSDEIGALAKAFLNMTEGLKERDKIKGVFDKFHSKEIAKKLLSGEIKLGGERKQATVFFSDIRSFTSISEKMTPDQVVAMLNEYFTAMVKIIFDRSGVVDKYIGDAILALWGVPEGKPNDAINAVRACLEMRSFMVNFNKKRVASGLPEIKIGMGLHSGEVLAGNIGSIERLEYTVIGDTVNQASRIEGATKALGADFLISDTTFALVENLGVVAGPGIAIKAKGKSEPLIVHQVIGYKDANGKLVTSLTNEQIDKIKSGVTEIQSEDEVKSSLVTPSKVRPPDVTVVVPPPAPVRISPLVPQTASINSELMSINRDMSSEDENAEVWYVVHDPGSKEYQGPMSLKQMAVKVHNKQFDYNLAYCFKMGDSQMTPLNQIPELNRRAESPAKIEVAAPETAIRNQAQQNEWYVAGPNGQTLGPYSEDDLRVALGKGNITRTTYVWRAGMSNWIYLHDIPGFDRRDVA